LYLVRPLNTFSDVSLLFDVTPMMPPAAVAPVAPKPG